MDHYYITIYQDTRAMKYGDEIVVLAPYATRADAERAADTIIGAMPAGEDPTSCIVEVRKAGR